MNLKEIREKYPQYSDIDDEQLTKGLHQKFYSDMDYYDFSKRIGFEPPEVTYEATPPIDIPKPTLFDKVLGVGKSVQDVLAGVPEVDLAPADYPGGLPDSKVIEKQEKPSITPLEKPQYEELGLPVGEPEMGAKALGVPFIPMQAILEAPGAVTEAGLAARPEALEEKGPSILDIAEKAGQKLAIAFPGGYTAEDAGEALDLDPELAGMISRVAVDLGANWLYASGVLKLLGATGKGIVSSNLWRRMHVRERQLVAQTLDNMVAGMKAQGASEAQILRKVKENFGSEAAFERFAKQQGIKPEPATPRQKVKEDLDTVRATAAEKLDGTFKMGKEKVPAEPKFEMGGLKPAKKPAVKPKPIPEPVKEKKVVETKPPEAVEAKKPIPVPKKTEVALERAGVKAKPLTLAKKAIDKEPKIAEIEKELGGKVDKAIDEVTQAGAVGAIKAMPSKKAPFRFKNKEHETRFTAAKETKEPLLHKTRAKLTALKNKATREYEHLPKTEEFAQLRFDLLRLSKQKSVASDRTLRAIQGVTIEMSPRDYDDFTRKVVMDDLVETGKEGKPLPYGFTRETAESELGRINVHIADNEVVQNAIKSRNKLWDAIKADYTKALGSIGFDVSGRLTRKNYFRHQVLEYINAKGLYGTGKKLKVPVGRGHLKKRKGSELDISSNYIQAEHEVMAQMIYDIEVARTIKQVDDNYNIINKLRKDAKKQDKDWREIIPEGYTIWQPREGNVFYIADSVPSKIAEELSVDKFQEIGIIAEDLRQVMAMGGKRKQFVIKDEIAVTLDDLIREKSKNVFLKFHQEAIRKWKIWQLISPRRYFKYNIRNLTGDSDAAFAGNPSVFKKSFRAARELYSVFAENKPMTPDLKDWFNRGGTQGTLQVQEMGDINRLGMFLKLQAKKGKLSEVPLKVWQKYWKTARLSTDYREGVLRYAAYLDYLEQMRKSTTGFPKDFGASNPKEIKGVQDIKDRAYWLSNDLIGAYDKVGVMGQAIREHLFPFWSWKEVNFKRYARMFANAANDGRLIEVVGRKTLGGAALRVPYKAWRISKWLIRATAFWTMLQVWNYTRFPEEEKSLPKNVRQKPHIILGRDKDGNIDYFSRLGALGDLLEWFGLDQIPEYTSQWLDGKMSLRDAAIDMAKQPVNVIVQGGVPFIKLGGELLTRRALFPDIFKPGTVRNRMMHIARSFGIENEYAVLADKPRPAYKKTLFKLFAYRVDPYQAAYYDIMNEKFRFMKKIGKYGEGFWLTPKSNALYNAKLALRYDDYTSSVEYMAKYFQLGGTMDGLSTSLESMNPLTGLSELESIAFMAQLDEDNKDRMAKALIYYYDLVMAKPKEVKNLGSKSMGM